MSSEERLGRRKAIVGLGASALGAAAGGVALGGAAVGSSVTDAQARVPNDGAALDAAENETPETDDAPQGLAPAGAQVRALFGDLTEGSVIGGRWRLESLHAVRVGAIPVRMATPSGQRFMVEVFRDTDAGPPPIARAAGLAFCIHNHGRGATVTGEDAGLGVRALAVALAERRHAGASMPAGLMTHAERMAQPRGVFDVPA